MTGTTARRLLRRAGFRLVRNGAKHVIMARGDDRVSVPHGGKMSPRAEKSLRRLLLERPTRNDVGDVGNR